MTHDVLPTTTDTLEARVLLTTTLFLDFGAGIGVGNTLSTTAGDFRDIFGTGTNNIGTGSNLAGEDGWSSGSTLEFTPLAYDFDGSGTFDAADITALANAVVPLVERALEPFDIDIVVASATSLADAVTSVNTNLGDASGEFDAYNFVMDIRSDATGGGSVGDAMDPHTGHEHDGADGLGLFGIAAGQDLFTQQGNVHDEATLTFADTILGSVSGTLGSASFNQKLAYRLAYTVTHEAFHTFGFVHSGSSSRTGDQHLLASGDVIRLGSSTREDPFMVTRFDLARIGLVMPDPNGYATLASDADIGLRDDNGNGRPDLAYVTGTGAHDVITLTRNSGTEVGVLVQAYSDAARTTLIAQESYTINLTTETDGVILIDGGINDDRIVLDVDIDADIRVRGGTGIDGGTGVDEIAFTGTPADVGFTGAGVGNATFLSGREVEFSETERIDLGNPGSISGTVFGDADGSGTQNGDETGVENFRVYVDQNNNQIYDDLTSSIEPDDSANFADIRTVNPHVTLSQAAEDNLTNGISVRAFQFSDSIASTGSKVIAAATAAEDAVLFNWTSTRRLRMDFHSFVTSVSIDAVSDDGNGDAGILEAYDAFGNLLARYDTGQFPDGTFETMTVTTDVAIAYAIAYGSSGQTPRLDNLRFSGAELSDLSDATGAYTITGVPVGSHRIGIVSQSNSIQTTQQGNSPVGFAGASVSPSQTVTGIDFGQRERVNTAPIVATNAAGNATYQENDPPLAFLSQLTITDAEDTQLTGATVQMTSGYQAGEDLLGVGQTLPGGIQASVTGDVVTFTGTASIADYVTAIRSVTYSNATASSTATRTVTVSATDANILSAPSGTQTGTATRGIDVTAANRQPVVDDQSFGIDENSATGAAVGTVVATDPDNDTLTYSIIAGNDAGAFDIDSSSGAIIVTDPGPLDHETTEQFTLTVRVTDGLLDDTATITIDVNDINEAPTLADATFDIDENSPTTTTVGKITGSDVDDGATLTYSITAGNEAGAFAIDAETGAITVTDSGPLDHETTEQFTLSVQVSDGTLTDTATITVDVNDINEQPAIDDQTFFVYADAADNARVGQVLATDPDDGQSLSSHIIGGNPGGAFAVDALSGELRVNNRLALQGLISLTIEVRDGASPELTDSATITVNVVTDRFDDVQGIAGTNWVVGGSDGQGFTFSEFGVMSAPGAYLQGEQLIGDFDGNGRTDIAVRNSTTGDWHVFLSDGATVTQAVWSTWLTGDVYRQLVAGDFNGDGRDDIAARRSDNGDWIVGLSNGSTFAQTRFGRWAAGLDWENASIGDFDGNGLTDVAGRVNGNWWISLSQGTHFATRWFGRWSTSVTWEDARVGDYDGDRRDDIAGRTNGSWWVSLSRNTVQKGDHFAVSFFERWSTRFTWCDVSVGDFDGDGRDDIAGRAGGNWWVSLSNGSTFTMRFFGRWANTPAWEAVTVGDYNGDGIDDIAGRINGNFWVSLSDGSAFETTHWGYYNRDTVWNELRASNTLA